MENVQLFGRQSRLISGEKCADVFFCLVASSAFLFYGGVHSFWGSLLLFVI